MHESTKHDKVLAVDSLFDAIRRSQTVSQEHSDIRTVFDDRHDRSVARQCGFFRARSHHSPAPAKSVTISTKALSASETLSTLMRICHAPA